MNDNEVVCRFCLKIADGAPKIVEEVTRQILEVLQIQVNVKVNEDSVMCNNCAETISRLFSFKSLYVIMEQMVLEFALRENKAIVDLKDFFKAENFDTILNQDMDMCRICMKWNNTADLTSISTLINDNVYVKMWTKYITELDLTITKYPKICFDCKDNIQCYSSFVLNVRDVEENLSISSAILGTKNKSMTGVEMHKSSFSDCKTLSRKHILSRSITHKKKSKAKIYKCSQCDYKSLHKGNFNQHVNIHQSQREGKKYKCLDCRYETLREDLLNRHRRGHREDSQHKIYKCPKCIYETHRRDCFVAHSRIHLDRSQLKMYKCLECSYETSAKGQLNRHKKIHEGRKQLSTYKCLKCSYETHSERSCSEHLLIHQD